jgi:hypothetical protein
MASSARRFRTWHCAFVRLDRRIMIVRTARFVRPYFAGRLA